MGRLIIPHEDPDPPVLETPTPVHFAKEIGLTWADFHPETGQNKPSLPQPNNASLPQWQRIRDEIENLRARFIKSNPKGFDPRCSNLDRSAVIAVYNEALIALEHASNIDAIKVHLEVKTKISTKRRQTMPCSTRQGPSSGRWSHTMLNPDLTITTAVPALEMTATIGLGSRG